MTYLIYVCTDVQGNKFETHSYAKAQECKAKGGSFITRYEEVRTY